MDVIGLIGCPGLQVPKTRLKTGLEDLRPDAQIG